MTTDRDPRTPIVLSWLREDAHENAEGVLLRALDDVDMTPQRRPWWPTWRFPDMNSLSKLAIGAAAVVVVAVAAIQFLQVGTGPGGQPTVSPSPTASPPPLGDGPLSPGRYALTWDGPATSLEVPAGWIGEPATVWKGEEGGVGWAGWPGPVTQVFPDACLEGVPQLVDGTLQGLVDALDDQRSTDATITQVTLGGRPATRVDLVPTPGLDMATCSEGAEGPLKIWYEGEALGYYALTPGGRGIVLILENDGELVIFKSSIGPNAAASDLAELEAVIASTLFGP